MRRHITRVFGLAAVALALATTAQAQGRGHGKGHKGHDDNDRDRDSRDRNGAVIVRRSDGDVVIPGNGRRVPPGLAKKPGQMPPGQYKKVYSTYQGASVLSDILRQRGYTVTRVSPYGESQYVYYRDANGRIRRALVSPGSDRLQFSNITSSILQAVLSRLY